MTLAAGAKLGPYEIVAPIGAGGMGEVYRAKDTRLDREVAIKVLPEHLSASTELRSRFEREARAISSLSHPHICTLHDIGREGDTDFLVMELLDGESLAQRLEKGPLPIEQVLKLGIQIADALERAHSAGIVHRDLKPGNVFLSERGAKLLDFGLAKLHAAGDQHSQTQLGALPTEQLSAPLTSAGMILGTFQYMSPEQLEGKESDARSDIFALGCVLYEMATGKKAFTGNSQASLIGSIMNSSPAPVSALAPLSPPALDRVISTCLAKDPKERWHTAHDVRLQLQWIAEGGSQIGLPAPVAARRKNREMLAWATAALFAIATAVATAGYLHRSPEPKRMMRFDIAQPAELNFMGEPKIAPDGGAIAFTATDKQGKNQVWIRPMAALEAHPLAGTDGVTTAVRPFWSDDSQFLGYFVDGKLMKIPVNGGPPQKIADTDVPGGDGTWSRQGVILFDGGPNDPIHRVDAAGGVPKIEQPTGSAEHPFQTAWPQFLPDGQHYLYIVFGGAENENGVYVAKLDGGRGTRLVGGLSRVEFAPPDRLLFVRESTLVAQRFDAGAAKLVGEPVPLAEGLGISSVGLADFSASRTGSLVFRAGQNVEGHLTWFDLQSGKPVTGDDPGDGSNPAISPDGRWLATQRSEAKNQDIWLRDLKRGVSSRLTTDPKREAVPLFTPDGKSVIFSRDEGKDGRALVERSLESSAERVLVPPALVQVALSIAPDGRTLAYAKRRLSGSGAQSDIYFTDLASGGEGKPYAATDFSEFYAAFSPDGKWLAYYSEESGRGEVYVQSFPDPGRKWQISTQGGWEPIWSRDGRTIYYAAPGNKLMGVDVRISPTFDAGIPQELYTLPFLNTLARNLMVIAPDGKRILINASSGDTSAAPTTVVLNWDAASGR